MCLTYVAQMESSTTDAGALEAPGAKEDPPEAEGAPGGGRRG